MPRWSSLAVAISLTMRCSVVRAGDFQGSTHRMEFDSELILYPEGVPRDPANRAMEQIAKAPSARPAYDRNLGDRPAVLRALGVSLSWQMLVFSKTPFQRGFIRPDNARALYFSSAACAGYLPGAPVLEIATVSSILGTVFSPAEQDRTKPLAFERSLDCLSCHCAAPSIGGDPASCSFR